MSEPVTTTGATAALTGVTFLGLLSGIDAGVVIGAFAGSVVFVLSAPDFTLAKRLMLFAVSFFSGLLSSAFIASVINSITPDGVIADKPLGALIASAIAVRLLMFMSKKADDPTSLIDHIRGRDRNE